MDEYQDVIKQLIAQEPTAIIAFGSRVWGKTHKDSDLDVLVIKNTAKSHSDRIKEIHSQISSRLPLDVIVLTPEEAKKFSHKYSFYRDIFQKGEIIYGRI